MGSRLNSRPVHSESACWSVVTSTGGVGGVELVDQLVGVLGGVGGLVLGVVAELADDDVVVVLDLGGGDLAVVDGLRNAERSISSRLGRPAGEPDAHEEHGGADDQVEQGDSRDAFHGGRSGYRRRRADAPGSTGRRPVNSQT